MPLELTGLPPKFVKQAKDLEAQGGALTTTKMVAMLGTLEGKKPEVCAAAAAWLLEKGEFGAFTLPKSVKSTLQVFVTDNGGSLNAASSPMSTRLAAGGKAVALSAAVKSGVVRGAELAASRDEITWNKPRSPPSPSDYFTPPTQLTLDAGDGKKPYLVYVAKRTGIDMDMTKTNDVEKAHRFVLFDQVSGKVSTEMNLLKSATGSALPGAGTSQPGLNMPALDGVKLPSNVAMTLDSALDRAVRTGDSSWRTAREPPRANDHFAPPYKMQVDGPDGKRIDVLVYFSKNPSPSFAAPPKTAEESKRATFYDPAGKHIITDVTFSMPGRVTLPVVGGGV